jgi:pullulanase/glycogen debranching enzyme
MSLMMMKEFTEKHTLAERKEDKNSKLFSILSSHTLLKEMKNIAELNDPMKQIQDKGKNIFPQNSSIGNDYIRITL